MPTGMSMRRSRIARRSVQDPFQQIFSNWALRGQIGAADGRSHPGFDIFTQPRPKSDIPGTGSDDPLIALGPACEIEPQRRKITRPIRLSSLRRLETSHYLLMLKARASVFASANMDVRSGGDADRFRTTDVVDIGRACCIQNQTPERRFDRWRSKGPSTGNFTLQPLRDFAAHS